MLLAVDVGNTDIKVGVFDGERLSGTWRWATDRSRMPDEYAAQLGWVLQHNEISFEAIEGSVLCSVVPQVTSTFVQLIRRYLGTEPLVVHAGIRTDIHLAVNNPAEVGGDRIANAVAALRLYGAPAVVVDLGTATNFDVISPEGAFLGRFAPGLATGIDGLLAHAARLQRFDLVRPSRAIGTNTIACLQSGSIFGHVGMVEYLLSRIAAEIGAPPLVIGTGGLVEIIAAETRAFTVIDRDLTLKGLRILNDLKSGFLMSRDPLAGRHIVLGVTGSIAAYKAVAIASGLVQRGAVVDVAMSPEATRLVQPLSFQAITHRPVAVDMFHLLAETQIGHVSMGHAADVFVVAPATAHSIAKLALGLADDMVTTTALATRAPPVLAPAMESNMWRHEATQAHVETLRRRGWTIVEPDAGHLASGAVGEGRLAPPERILEAVSAVLAQRGDLTGWHVAITAGGTREPIDPVRYISNRSSGKMGYAIATAARDRGARVTLISTVGLPPPYGVHVEYVERAREMREAVLATLPEIDVLVMAAAVADYEPAAAAASKLKKTDQVVSLELAPTPDILADAAAQRGDRARPILVGFAAETENLIAHARDKLLRKRLDLLVANDVTLENSGFASDFNKVTFLRRDGSEVDLPLMPKTEVAHHLWDEVVEGFAEPRGNAC